LPQADWQRSDRVQVITTNRRERSIARNTGAALAAGEYLCFLDDDDWLLPNALIDFQVLARAARGAVWLCGGLQVVDETGACNAKIDPNLNGDCLAKTVGGAWAPIQSSLVKAETFFKMGGFDPAICGTEDLDLARRCALQGDFATTTTAVACLLRGRAWATSTNYLRAPEDTLRSRDGILNETNVFRRLLRSAPTSFWRGRILRVYASTTVHNLRHWRLSRAVSRGIFGFIWLTLATRFVVSPDFWRAAHAHHVPNTLHFVVAEMERQQAAQPDEHHALGFGG
jgi:glycosyltransferase involved in cell wall biosynthesis